MQRIRQEIGGLVYSGAVSPVPGCPDLAVSHAVYRHPINPEETGKGVMANKVRTRQIAELGYSCVMCTVESSNERQLSILEKTGWQKVFAFVNQRTQHEVFVFMKSL